jgi:predicted DNA-binding transcriptional regulator AlpA
LQWRLERLDARPLPTQEAAANDEHLKLPSISEVAEIPRDQIPAVLAHLHALAGSLTARLLETDASADELLDVAEAARRFDMSEDWLYHNRELPFRRKIGGRVKYSAHGIDRWLRSRQGAR